MNQPFFSLADLGMATSSAEALQTWLASMQQQFPGYSPSTGNLDYVQALIISSLAADLGRLCSSGGDELFQTFGTSLLGLPVQTGVPATAVLNVTATDTAGHVLPAGTQFTLTLGGAPLGFATAADLTIAAGANSGQVTVAAVSPGSDFNAAGSPAQIITPVNWVASTAVLTPASGGQDAEDPAHYLNRLKGTLQTLAPRPITATDFAQIAVDFTPAAGTDQQDVGRATAIDGYSPNSGLFNVERTVTVCVTDASGNPVNADTLTAVKTWLQTLREVTFVVFVVSPNYSTVYVSAQIKALPGWDAATVQANVQASLLNYLTPVNWGLPPVADVGWNNYTTVFRSKIDAVIQNTGGVDYVQTGTLSLDLSPGPSNTTGDLLLPGPFPMAVSSTTSIPLSALTVT